MNKYNVELRRMILVEAESATDAINKAIEALAKKIKAEFEEVESSFDARSWRVE